MLALRAPRNRGTILQAANEYLVSYGKNGEFGRFAAAEPLACRRGDALVIETNRGLEIGSVIRSADPELLAF